MQWGVQDENGSWNGVIGDLQFKAVISLKITNDFLKNENYHSFWLPLYNKMFQ